MQQHANVLELSLADEQATRELAAAFARICQPGDVFLVQGPLGAGKTTFVDAFAKELGTSGATSPTFVIAHSYPGGRIPIWHLDLYRLDEQREVDELDLSQYVRADAVTLVEWPERAGSAWPADRIEIQLRMAQPGRAAEVRGFGAARATIDAARATIDALPIIR